MWSWTPIILCDFRHKPGGSISKNSETLKRKENSTQTEDKLRAGTTKSHRRERNKRSGSCKGPVDKYQPR